MKLGKQIYGKFSSKTNFHNLSPQFARAFIVWQYSNVCRTSLQQLNMTNIAILHVVVPMEKFYKLMKNLYAKTSRMEDM